MPIDQPRPKPKIKKPKGVVPPKQTPTIVGGFPDLPEELYCDGKLIARFANTIDRDYCFYHLQDLFSDAEFHRIPK